MDQDTYEEVLETIKSRATWESRQDTWYRMRFTGIRRTTKPYKDAPDVHYPLADTDIEKLKPLYASQLYSDLVLATFVCEPTLNEPNLAREQLVSNEQWFDFQLKQKSNFERSIFQGIDLMLERGFCPVKYYWDTEKKQICYDACDPLYVIVPEYTEDDPDWLIHVKRLSKAQYRRNPNYTQGKEFIDSIAGGGQDGSTGVGTTYQQTKATREGITYTQDKNSIIIWECYTREGDKWVVEEIAPTKGLDGGVVRKKMGLPPAYECPPFVILRHDDSQRGWYSSRGIPEIVALHELALNKNWNSQLQFLDFFGHPQYKNTGLTPINPGNFQGKPGMILPQGVEPVGPVSAPLDFQQQMQFVRALAEDRVAIPDLGTAENLSGPNMKGGKTATAVNAVVALSSQTNDMRAKSFRRQLGKLYQCSWGLLKEYAKDQVGYISDNKAQTLDPTMFQYKYNIVPSGSADSWNKAQRIQDAMQIYQMGVNNPNVDQLENIKYLYESKDPRLINRLIKDAGLQAMKQGEKQAVETSVMLQGRQMTTDPSDDDQAHLQDLFGTFQRRLQTGEPITPEFTNLAFTHATQHVNQMKAKKHPQAAMWAKQLGQAGRMLQNSGMMQQLPQPGMPPQLQQPQQQGKEQKPQVSYGDAPPSVRRQMEMKEGYQPATLPESALEVHERVNKGGSKQQSAPPKPASAPQGEPKTRSVNSPAITVQMPEPKPLPAPVVNVQAPPAPVIDLSKVKFPTPVVHVEAPPTAPAPVVNVPQPKVTVNVPKTKRVRVIRNKEGEITGAEVEQE